MTRDRLVISSPGGLWGLTVDQLGTRDGKSAINERLYDICTLTTDTEGRRVIEGLGTGIRAVRKALRQADMEPVRFQETGVRFTALLPRAALPATKKGRERIPEQVAAVSTNAAVLWSCLGTTPKTRAQIAEATGLTDRQVKWALDRLKAAGFIVFQGRQGSTATTYRRA
ncbi:ATP-binding protein [Actinomyces ruminicola]|uniref:ATP-binding protein n=1 Tax=Actinomyces ruminicola TaxID=332524 RepID=UPI0021C2B517|nr:ATP-binding protein [Actinomyces ruminicola]